MSVIAKLNLLAVRAFGGGSLYELSCVCQNDLMAMYADSDEDKLFTTASPWGEARMNVSLPAEAAHPAVQSQFYAMLVHKGEPGFTTEPKGAFLVCPARILHVGDFGGTTKRVHISSAYNVPEGLALRTFSWSMSIDNPGASDQLKPGTGGWLFSLYLAGPFDKRTAIDAAHGK